MQKRKKIPRVLYVSTFPPRECGIATFTYDLTEAMEKLIGDGCDNKIVAMNPSEFVRFKYPKKVVMQIDEPWRDDYLSVAENINKMDQVKLVNIQHEFGIFGGLWGDYVVDFVNKIEKPVVVTLHTVLPTPDEKFKEIVLALNARVKKLIVMTNASKHILQDDYGIDTEKIEVIPHGIHPVEFKQPSMAKQALSMQGKMVLTTFGLLSKNKGIEYVLDALPEVVEKYPNLRYWIIGATHPVVLRDYGESYRIFLEKKVKDLKLVKNVRFYNQYLELPELLQFLKATDIYISSGLNPDQAVSGTLSYALGCGRPVISTRFTQAREVITDDVGLTVGFKDPEDYKRAILTLLENESKRADMAKNAFVATRKMTWPNVALAYWKTFCEAVPELREVRKNLPDIKLSHLAKMTDKFGLIQFAKWTVPNRQSGYTADDNSRALMTVGNYLEQKSDRVAKRLAETYLKFIEQVGSVGQGFANYVGEDYHFRDDLSKNENFEDTAARVFLALGWVMGLTKFPKELKLKALLLWQKKWNEGVSFNYPRAMAFWIKAAYFGKKGGAGNGELSKSIIKYCDKLVKAYDDNREEDWKWFEPSLTYSNSMLSEALLWGYLATENKKYLEIAQESLDFLISQTFEKGVYVPVGQNGWYFHKGKRQYFDQQPEDTSAMVRTLGVMYRVTHEKKYKKLMEKAFNWFLGENMLGLMMYDEATGGSYDGLGENYINLNEGAESTVSYLLARMAVEHVRKEN
jgi:glycosyltransferase involved in cell wall biosynthesis